MLVIIFSNLIRHIISYVHFLIIKNAEKKIQDIHFNVSPYICVPSNVYCQHFKTDCHRLHAVKKIFKSPNCTASGKVSHTLSYYLYTLPTTDRQYMCIYIKSCGQRIMPNKYKTAATIANKEIYSTVIELKMQSIIYVLYIGIKSIRLKPK